MEAVLAPTLSVDDCDTVAVSIFEIDRIRRLNARHVVEFEQINDVGERVPAFVLEQFVGLLSAVCFPHEQFAEAVDPLRDEERKLSTSEQHRGDAPTLVALVAAVFNKHDRRSVLRERVSNLL